MALQGLGAAKSALNAAAKYYEKKMSTAVKLGGNAYKSDVQKLAPYLTGTYRRSIHVEIEGDAGDPYALVGSGLPYSRRLEYGYADSDKLGRVYNQSAQPHFRPAADQNAGKYSRIIAEALK
jgi:HK97 gp10 family phage protein